MCVYPQARLAVSQLYLEIEQSMTWLPYPRDNLKPMNQTNIIGTNYEECVINPNAWLVSWHMALVWCGTLSVFILCSSLLPSVRECPSLQRDTRTHRLFMTVAALPNDAQYINLQYKSQNRHGIILRIPFHGDA